MAVIPRNVTEFDGQIDETDLANYPYGKAQNITNPGDGTGTPWHELLINDQWGFLQAILTATNTTPSGNPDTIQASQYLASLRQLFAPSVGGAKAWVNFNGVGAVTILDSFGVTSVEDQATGRYGVNFSESHPVTSLWLTGAGGTSPDRVATGFLSSTTLGEVRVVSTGNSPQDDAAISGVLYES